MMKIEAFYNSILEMVKSQYGITITLRRVRTGRVLPEVDVIGNVIRFNPKQEAFLTLYNHLLMHDGVDSEPVSLFALYNAHFDNDDYVSARRCLESLSQETGRLKSLLPGGNSADVMEAVNLQSLFILLHEAYHIIFHHLPDERAQFIAAARQRIEDLQIPMDSIGDRTISALENMMDDGDARTIYNKVKDELNEFLRNNADSIFDAGSYLRPDDDSMLEEFACDLCAWHLMMQQMTPYSTEQELAAANAVIFMALNIMDYDKFLKTLYAGSCEAKQIVNPRSAVLRHSFLRSYIYGRCQKAEKNHFSDFLHQCEIYEDRCRNRLIANLFAHSEDIAALHTAHDRRPDREAIKQLEDRFAEIEQQILHTL